MTELELTRGILKGKAISIRYVQCSTYNTCDQWCLATLMAVGRELREVGAQLSSLKREISIGRASYHDRITQHAFVSWESQTHSVQMVDSLKNQARTESAATNASLWVCSIPSRAECTHSVYYPSGKNQRTKLLTISFIQPCECIENLHIQLPCQLNVLHPAFSLRNAHNECI